MILKKAAYDALDEAEQLLVTLFLYLPEGIERDLLRNIAAKALPSFEAKYGYVGNILQVLEKRGYVHRVSAYTGEYRGRIELSAEDYSAIMREAEEKGWLPSAAAVESAARKAISTIRNVSKLIPVAQCARRLAGSASSVPDKAVAVDVASQRCAALHAARILIDEPQYDFTGDDAPLLHLMPYWLNIRFICERDVRKTLLAMNAALQSRKSGLDWNVYAAYAALCFWTGWKEGLAVVPDNLSRPELTCIAMCCKNALAGNMAVADNCSKSLERLEGFTFQSSLDSYDNRDLDNFPERLMRAMIAAVANPEKISKTRPKRIIAPSWRERGTWGRSVRMDEAYQAFVRKACGYFSNYWPDIVGGKGTLISGKSSKDVKYAIAGLTYAWDFRLLIKSRTKYVPTAARLFDLAKEAERLGYMNIAGLYLSLLSGAYDRNAEADFVKRVEASAVKFLPEIAVGAEWMNVLKVLKGVVQRAEKSVQRNKAAGKKQIVWYIVAEGAESHGKLRVERMYPATRKTGDPQDGSNDEQVDLSWRMNDNNKMKDFDEKDMLIARTLCSEHITFMNDNKRRALLPMLVGMERVMLRQYEKSSSGWASSLGSPKSVKVVEGQCEMYSAVTADGGIELSIPRWLKGETEGVILRWADEGVLSVVTVSKETAKLIGFFGEYTSSNGKITIPGAGMKEAAGVLRAMETILPVAAPSEKEKSRLRRVAATARINVRLSFADERLVVRTVLKPVPALPEFLIDPGEGQTEKVVADAGGSYLLVRDLDAEKANLAEVKGVLAAHETWYDGRFTWNIEDVAAALDALTLLKTLADAAPDRFDIEWIDERRLAVTSAPASAVALESRRTADDWFRVEGEFRLDDGRVLSVARMLEAARSRVGDFVRLSDGDYVRLTRKMARQLDALSAASRRKGDGVEVVKAAIPMLDKTFDGAEGSLSLPGAMAKTAEEIRDAFAKRPDVPSILNAELRAYQVDGYRWLSRLAACGFGSCLADDMGLGKTLQVIALLAERAKNGVSLVVAPSSVCGNWRSEIRRFAPALRPVMAAEQRETPLAQETAMAVVIASYNYLLFHEDEFAAVNWNGVVLDEAQAIKNDASKRAKTVKRLSARFRVAATGTPIENRLGELWSIFDFLNPGLLGAATSFTSRFTKEGMATAELKRLVKPLVLRRLKGDVLDDLPDKTEITLPVELGKEERSAYEGCRLHALAQLRKNTEEDGEEPNRMSILAELTRLRRFCCHPSLVLPGKQIPSAKMEALVELLGNLRESRHRALVFSQFTDYLAIVRRVIDARGWTHLYLDGSTPTLEREKLVNAFQGGEGDFFVISLKAGGTGLNLTAADYVILLDPWWNPAVENQAADRAHRIGQKNPVTVYRLIASDTVEERVLELHKEKKEIAEDVLDGTGSASLSPAQLMRLFGTGEK